MPTPQLCTEDEIVELVHAFYSRVRDDAVLGPIFDAHVKDWNEHLAKMVTFWSSALRGSKSYRGMPMPVHAGLPGLTQGLFEHWLDLFFETAHGLPNRQMAERAVDLAQRIAQSLWFGYRLNRETAAMPGEPPIGGPIPIGSGRE